MKLSMVLIISSMLLFSCGSVDSSDTPKETVVAQKSGNSESELYSDLLNSALDIPEDAELLDFDRLMKEVAEFNEDDFKKYKEDHDSVTEIFSGESIGRNDHFSTIVYGDYILRIDPEAGGTFEDDSQTYIPGDLLRFIVFPSNLMENGNLPFGVDIRLLDENGNDLPVPEYNKDMIDNDPYAVERGGYEYVTAPTEDAEK